MRLKHALAAVAITAATIATPVSAHAAAPSIGHSHAAHVAERGHACTHTSSGTCIRGGQFCPQSKYGQSGWDAQGRRYVCKGDHTHPHWMVP